MTNVETIICRACQQEKPAEHFRVQAHRKTGRDTLCSHCRSLHRRANGEYLRHLVYKHARRAGQAIPHVSEDDFIDIFETYKDCPYCGYKLDDTNRSIDHVYPLSSSYGGKHIRENIVACCLSCNKSKHNTPSVYDFYQRKESFTPDLWRQFIKTWIGRMIGRELTALEVDEMTFNMKAESEEIKQRAKPKEKAV